MNLSTVASLVLLAAVGTVAYPSYEDTVPETSFAQAEDATDYFNLAVLNELHSMDGLNTLSAVGSLPDGAIETIKLRTKNAATELVQLRGIGSWAAKKGLGLVKPMCPGAVASLLKKLKGWASTKASAMIGKAAKYCHSSVCAWIDGKAAKFVSGIGKQCGALCDQAAGALTTKLGNLAGKVKEADMAKAICDKAFTWMDKKLRL